jgi:hypothetical protein
MKFWNAAESSNKVLGCLRWLEPRFPSIWRKTQKKVEEKKGNGGKINGGKAFQSLF